jgi:hypothetical protein
MRLRLGQIYCVKQERPAARLISLFILFLLFMPMGVYPNITLPHLKLRALNRLIHVISQKIAWWTYRIGFEQGRCRAGLAKRILYVPFGDPLRPPTPILCAWSSTVLPTSNDWLPKVHVTGYFFFDLNSSYRPAKVNDSTRDYSLRLGRYNASFVKRFVKS